MNLKPDGELRSKEVIPMVEPWYDDGQSKLFLGDAREVLAQLEPENIHTVVTSPPYWGQRTYRGEQEVIWDGDPSCQHEWGSELRKRGHKAGETNPGKEGYTKNAGAWSDSKGAFCLYCNAWRGALGHEPTREMYADHLVEIFREVRRVLRKDGTVWLNLGDSYAGSGSPGGDFRDGKGGDEYLRPYNRQGDGLKPLDLCRMPSKVAEVLQADGWYLRSEIVWVKPSTMPESVDGWRWERHKVRTKVGKAETGETRADRPLESPHHAYRGDGWEIQAIEGRPDSEYRDCPGCPKCTPNDGCVLRKGAWRATDAHEYIYMLTKSPQYYADKGAVAEPVALDTPERYRYAFGGPKYEAAAAAGESGPQIGFRQIPSKRNLRDVWVIGPEPSSLAHFAVFPEELPTKCILASTSEKGVCPKCGAPWARVIKYEPSKFNVRVRDAKAGRATPAEGYKASEEEIASYNGRADDISPRITLGWRPTCKCGIGEDTIPATVLDPFCGTGTTLVAARKLGRRAIGIDISAEYLKMAHKRLEALPLSFPAAFMV